MRSTTLGVSIAVLSAGLALGQTNLDFTQIKVTAEGAIQLFWNSTTNEVYEVDYADQLASADDGSTVWLPLYTDYPSHGSNTFIADAGNYDISPEIPHPRLSLARFYRVMLTQTNDSPSNPSVSVAWPTNGAALSGDVTVEVSASSSEILSDIKVYVDGEEQWSSIGSTNSGGTNFLINTCEWPNGTHVVFATAESQSGLEGVANGGPVTYGRAVSAYRAVTFSNLITRFDFSEPYFEPALGQTQRVSAVFATGVNWTLEIRNAADGTIRFASGSGASMQFDWDGTGTNGVALPDGVYSYLLTVGTNGQSYAQSSFEAGSSEAMNAANLSGAESEGWYPRTAKQALAAGWNSYFIQFPPLPPYKSNGVWVVRDPQPPLEMQIPENVQAQYTQSMAPQDSVESGGANLDAYGGPASQATRGPKRKYRVGVKGEVGSFGICYKTYGTNGFTSPHPLTGLPFPLQTHVAIDEQSPTALTTDYRVRYFQKIADDFSQTMEKKAWRQKFVKKDDQWGSSDIKKSSLGGSSIFNSCNFGVLMTHGSYANNNSQGNSANGVKYTYNWLLTLSNHVSENLKLSDMDFGSDGTNGLRWMTILACNILRPANYTSMNNNGVIPVNDNLHLLLGFSTTGYASANLGKYYANYLVNSNYTIVSSLADACADSYTENSTGITNIVRIGISGWNSCMNDGLGAYNDPDLNGLQFNERTVFIPP